MTDPFTSPLISQWPLGIGVVARFEVSLSIPQLIVDSRVASDHRAATPSIGDVGHLGAAAFEPGMSLCVSVVAKSTTE